MARWVSSHAEMQAQHQKMQQLVLSEDFNEAEVRALAEEMSEQQVERRVAMLKQRHEMMQVSDCRAENQTAGAAELNVLRNARPRWSSAWSASSLTNC